MRERRRLRRLTKSFYSRDALSVAKDLIGCLFVRETKRGRAGVRLVEVEAYRGRIDPGSHGHRGPTERTRVMYGPPGYLYVYFSYGMHWCANIVCASEGVCEAVLLRAGEPLLGLDAIRRNRPGIKNDRLLAAGPARLAKALGIDRRHNGASLLRGGEFWCAEDPDTDKLRASEVSQTVRIGLGAGKGAEIPWRFVVPNNPYTSRRQ